MKAVVVFSGGQDSTTCLLQAVSSRGAENLEALSFSYGQKHELELEAAQSITSELGVRHTVMDAGLLGQIVQSALLKGGGEIKQGDKCPNTVVDGRNMLFLFLAAVYAKSRDIKDIIAGVCQTDFSGYPDCRDVFIKSLNVTLNLAMDYEFRLITPLMWLTKKETWALADSLGRLEFIRTRTHSCYNNVRGGCGSCPACVLRERGYREYAAEKAVKEAASG
ncbi:MAG: 7-cyano-7-deazaguanine synthase QueC [Acidaminococcales bacterium]|jgi:7-cyano-7-deazaguanine synthase|nr:7-cyano-7-deazaguanine synthase QueC [Acidaminococcales bacterium]